MSLTHTGIEIARHPDGRRRWRVGARTYTEIPLPEGGADGPTSEDEIDSGLFVDEFRRTLTRRQSAALDDLLQDVPAAIHARKIRADASVVRRRYARVLELFEQWHQSRE